MVSELVKSGLLSSLPEDAEPSPSVPEDPWKNIFRKPFVLGPYFHHPRDDVAVEDIGMFDAEDGGIYRCLDCMHEIWPDGVCSGCQRQYPAHHALADADEILGQPVTWAVEFTDEEEDEGYEQSFIDDESDRDDALLPLLFSQAEAVVLSEEEDESDDDPRPYHFFGQSVPQRGTSESIILSDDDDEDTFFQPTREIHEVSSEDSSDSGSVHAHFFDDGEENDDDGEAPVYRHTRLRHNALIVEDDSEDED